VSGRIGARRNTGHSAANESRTMAAVSAANISVRYNFVISGTSPPHRLLPPSLNFVKQFRKAHLGKCRKKATVATEPAILVFTLALYNPFVDGAKAPEFDPQHPVASAAAVLRAIFLRPKPFYSNFNAEGPVREPAVFVLLVSAVSGVLSVVANATFAAVFGTTSTNLWGVAALNLAFVVLSPVLVGVAAGAYLLSIRGFVGPGVTFREVYRMLAYAYGAMILFWVPIVNAFAFTYGAVVLIGLGIRSVYRTSFLTTLVTTLVGFVPVSIAFIYLLGMANSFVSG
jgi:hypothetical protein